MLSLLLLLAAVPTCDVAGTDVSLRAFDVSIPGLKPARFGLTRVDLTARFGPHGQERLTVTSPVSLEGRAPRLWLSLQRPVTTDDGLVTLRPGAQVIPRKTKGVDARGVAWVAVDVVLHADDVLEEENDKEPDETLSPVLVPCDALGFHTTREHEPDSVDEDLKGLSVRGASIALRSAPREGVPTRVLRGASYLQEKRRFPGGWVEVETEPTIGGGVKARGFVRTNEVKPVPEGEGLMRGAMCTGGHHLPEMNFGFADDAKPMRRGRVTVRADMPVRVEGQIVLRTTREFEINVHGEAAATEFTLESLGGIEFPLEWSASIDASSLLTLPPLMPMTK